MFTIYTTVNGQKWYVMAGFQALTENVRRASHISPNAIQHVFAELSNNGHNTSEFKLEQYSPVQHKRLSGESVSEHAIQSLKKKELSEILACSITEGQLKAFFGEDHEYKPRTQALARAIEKSAKFGLANMREHLAYGEPLVPQKSENQLLCEAILKKFGKKVSPLLAKSTILRVQRMLGVDANYPIPEPEKVVPKRRPTVSWLTYVMREHGFKGITNVTVGGQIIDDKDKKADALCAIVFNHPRSPEQLKREVRSVFGILLEDVPLFRATMVDAEYLESDKFVSKERINTPTSQGKDVSEKSVDMAKIAAYNSMVASGMNPAEFGIELTSHELEMANG